jgi:hypothetical protein
MGKQTKSKSKPAQRKGAAPYVRPKATVEVSYEGDSAAKSKSAAKPKAAAKAEGKAKAKVVEKKEKKEKDVVPSAKGKARAVPAEVAAETDIEVEEQEVAEADENTPTFKVIAGSYEKILYGLEGRYAPGASEPTLTPIFIFPAHIAMIKTVAASPGGKWLATGAEDEFVKVWDLRRRKEVGSLSQHTGELISLWLTQSKLTHRHHHVAHVPHPVAPSDRICGRYALALPHVRLGAPQVAKGPLGACQPRRRAPYRSRRALSRKGQHPQNVGPHARPWCRVASAGH